MWQFAGSLGFAYPCRDSRANYAPPKNRFAEPCVGRVIACRGEPLQSVTSSADESLANAVGEQYKKILLEKMITIRKWEGSVFA